MFLKRIVIVCTLSLIFLLQVTHVFAVENPLARANNKFGIHILFPTEVQQAAQLVNSNGGEWGYVVIPIQIGDLNVQKWQQFMDNCRQYKVIPIIRIATGPDAANTSNWRIPTDENILDFANFLNSLDWPIKNRYVILFNEVNRSDEFGGTVNPALYANIVNYATVVFKVINPDFYMISAGLDNAAADTTFSMNEYDYIRAMNQAVPGIFNKLDGIASHSYPNPGMEQPPSILNSESIASFQYERQLIETMTSKQLPVFITETGWPTDSTPDATAATYYQQAFSTIWEDPNIVTVAPFLLQADGGLFSMFSFLSITNSQTPVYTAIANMPKVKGKPTVTQKVLGEQIARAQDLPTENFSHVTNDVPTTRVSKPAKDFFKWLLGFR